MEWLGRNRKSVIIAVVLMIAFAAGYFFYKSRNAEQGRLILYGNVDIRQISLAFNSNGRIEEMLKEEGDAVKAGDVLARLDTRPLELAIAQRKAAIAHDNQNIQKIFDKLKDLSPESLWRCLIGCINRNQNALSISDKSYLPYHTGTGLSAHPYSGHTSHNTLHYPYPAML